MNSSNLIREHYTFPDMLARIKNALHDAGMGEGQIDWSKLAQLDQFHVRGLVATKELAEGLKLTGGESVLDVGSGLGGPARYLAAIHGCHVTGIELTPLYIEIANYFSKRTGLSERLRFIEGNALELPFPETSFDHAWTQHVAMNISNKERLYQEVYRVLKPGGRLAMYDVVRGANAPVIYPAPWADNESQSFLASPPEVEQLLSDAGFRTISAVDTTSLGLAWFDELQKAQQSPQGIPSLSLVAVIGSDARQFSANLARNLQEDRVRLMQVIVQKD